MFCLRLTVWVGLASWSDMDPHDRLLKAMLHDYQARRAKNASFSLRAYARFLGIQPSGLSNIFNGQRRISRKIGAKIISRISLDPNDAMGFLQALKSKYPRTDAAMQYVLIERATFEVISNWYYLAILTLAETNDFDSTPTWIAHRLGISSTKAAVALKTLTSMGYLSRDGKTKKLRPTHKNFATTVDIPDLAIQKSHLTHLDLAAAALQDQSVHRREFGFTNIAIDPTLIPEAKARIRKFRRDLCAFLEGKPKKTAVFRLGVQLFALTKDVETHS